jgi:hypothetical protein
MCITFSIRQVMHITYVENKLWKKKIKEKNMSDPTWGRWTARPVRSLGATAG